MPHAAGTTQYVTSHPARLVWHAGCAARSCRSLDLLSKYRRSTATLVVRLNSPLLASPTALPCCGAKGKCQALCARSMLPHGNNSVTVHSRTLHRTVQPQTPERNLHDSEFSAHCAHSTCAAERHFCRSTSGRQLIPMQMCVQLARCCT